MSRRENSSISSTQAANKLRTLLRAEEIDARVHELAAEIRRDYANKGLTLVVVLKGAFVFAADLVRALELPAQVEFISAESYGDRMVSSGSLQIRFEPRTLVDRDVLVIEDIVDTGLTLSRVKQRMFQLGARSVRLCALLDKPSRRQVELNLDYVGFVVPDVFVAGYGIDYAQRHRQLPEVCVVDVQPAAEDEAEAEE